MVTEQAHNRAAETFQGLLLRHRGRTELTQRQLAAKVGVSRGSIQDWEAGLSYPDARHLQALIAALLEAGGLTVESEAIEAEALWAAALRLAPRMQTPFDPVWWAGLQARQFGLAESANLPSQESAAEVPPVRRTPRRQDWGEAPDLRGFVGRAAELATLRYWVLVDGCRLLTVLGMGGIGKTAMASRLVEELAPSFERMYWRSLRDAPPTSEWLAGAIGFLSDQQVPPPASEPNQLAALLQLLRDRRCLLVLDNFETLLEPAQREGRYRAGLAGYGALLLAVGETAHQSCVVVTSREAPAELAVLGGHPVRTLELGGLRVGEGQVLLADKQLSGSTGDWADLVGRFGGNGLALKVVGERIGQVFGGDIHEFLDQAGSGTIFGGIRRLLADQLERSTALEQNVLRALAVEREPVALGELIADLGPHVRRGFVLEAVEALRRRSLVERAKTAGVAAFTLQSVVLEYVTDRLVDTLSGEIANGRPVELVDQPLIKAQSKDYVRHTQESLIGLPILQKLEADREAGGARQGAGLEQRLLTLLADWRNRPLMEQGYGPGNVVNLLRLLRGNLRGLDLGGVALRQAYLAGVEAQDASLAGTNLAEAVLAEAFNYPISVALSSDGASLLAGTSAGEVWLWRVADRTPLLAVAGHTGPVYGVALSADGQVLASGSQDGTVRLWAASGTLLSTLEGHTGGVRGVALSADGQLVASGSFDGTIRLWAAPGGRQLDTLHGHIGPVYGVALSADGQLLASGGEDRTVRLWDPRSARQGVPGATLLTTLEGHTNGVRSVALSADGQLVASGSRDDTVRVWAAPSGQLLATLSGHTGSIYGIALSADGRLLASGSQDGTIRLWDPRSAGQGVPGGQLLATLHGHTGGVRGVALSADGRLASGGLDGTMRLWEGSTGRLLATMQGQTRLVYGVALSADGRLLAAGSLDGNIRLWDAPSGKLLATLPGQSGLVYDLALSADGQLLASASWDGTIQLWDARFASASRSTQFTDRSDAGNAPAEPGGVGLLATLQGHIGGVRSVALSADGRLLVSGGLDGMIRLWETPSGRMLGELEGHVGGVRCVVLSAHGRMLASSGWDGTVRLWETRLARLGDDEPARPLATLRGHTGPVYGVAISADERLLASAGEDRTVRLWNTASGTLLNTLEGHTDGVRDVALSADGRLLVSGSWDGTIRLWDASSGSLLSTLEGHTSGVWGVALSADGRLLASGSFDGTIRLWNGTTGTYLRSLRSQRRYEGMDITGVTGVTDAQRAALFALGAVDHA